MRLISVSRRHWGGEVPDPLSAVLLPPGGEDLPYRFTGKQHPLLEPQDLLVFRFEGKFLGECIFLRWAPRTRNGRYRMLYKTGQQYKEPVLGSRFLPSSANRYPFTSASALRDIRQAALRPDQGPYVQTGTKKSLTTHRIGQGAVRKSALERYSSRCCLCPIDNQNLLVAGHIKGWAEGEKERGDHTSVILMCAFHDCLFGRGFSTLQPHSYGVRISTAKLSPAAYDHIKKATFKFRKPASHPPAREYLAWHKRHPFAC